MSLNLLTVPYAKQSPENLARQWSGQDAEGRFFLVSQYEQPACAPSHQVNGKPVTLYEAEAVIRSFRSPVTHTWPV